MNSKKSIPEVHCPNCKTRVPWCDEQRWKPFCSERCKMIDLGEWLDEQNVIPGDSVIDESDM